METLYISFENCYVRAEGEHLRLMQRGKTLTTVPLAGVKTVIVFDSVHLSAPALDLLVTSGIDILYLSKWGKLKARVLSAKGGNAILKLAQYAAFMNPDIRLQLAKSIVSAKINNQLSLIRKYKYHDTNPEFDENIKKIETYSDSIANVESINELMGFEGISAKCYWDCFRHLLKNPVFTRREYRPSPDYVNALLNLTYAFLSNEITTCLITKNFDLELGMLHSIHYGRNSLVLDIMEEFRAPFADSWVVSTLNKNRLKAEHFHHINSDWRLTDDGFHKFCEIFHERAPDWRDKFRTQADKLKNAMIKGEMYEPYRE